MAVYQLELAAIENVSLNDKNFFDSRLTPNTKTIIKEASDAYQGKLKDLPRGESVLSYYVSSVYVPYDSNDKTTFLDSEKSTSEIQSRNMNGKFIRTLVIITNG